MQNKLRVCFCLETKTVAMVHYVYYILVTFESSGYWRVAIKLSAFSLNHGRPVTIAQIFAVNRIANKQTNKI